MNDKSKKILKILKRNLRLKTLIFLILFLVLNTCAWYIYISEISSDITTHVKAWKIEFGNNISQDIDFVVDNIYPGMETVTKEIELVNKGEMDAIISYGIDKMIILEEEYTVDGENITADDLVDSICNNYPFKVKFYINGENVKEKKVNAGQTAYITIEISWPFNSGDDKKDTYWGNKAYDFMEENPEKPCILIKARIKANQSQE